MNMSRRIAWGGQGLVAAGAVLALTAAPAGAYPTLSIAGNPGQLQVGSTYVLSDATAGWGAWVYFYDNGQCIGGEQLGMDSVAALQDWTPTTAGTHTLQAKQGSDTQTLTVTVQPAPAGTPVPTPPKATCGGGGSFQLPSGSFGL